MGAGAVERNEEVEETGFEVRHYDDDDDAETGRRPAGAIERRKERGKCSDWSQNGCRTKSS